MAKDNNNEKRTPTSRDWDNIRKWYMNNEDLNTIMSKVPNLKITKRGIVAKMNLEGITERRKAIQDAVMDNLQKNIETQRIEVNNNCINLYNTGAKVIEHLLVQYLDEVKQSDIPKMKAKATAYNLDMLMSGVTKIQKGLRVCYGMDDQGKLYEKEPEVLVIDGLDIDKI